MDKPYTYMLLMPDEDGNPVRFLTDDDVENIAELMEYYGIEKWRDNFNGKDPMYWQWGEGMLFKIELKTPKPVTVVQEWTI